IRLGWLPSVGRISVTLDVKHPTNFYILDALIQGQWSVLWDVIKHLILPAIALGSIPLAIITRITRAAVLDVENEDYVRTARARGRPAACGETLSAGSSATRPRSSARCSSRSSSSPPYARRCPRTVARRTRT